MTEIEFGATNTIKKAIIQSIISNSKKLVIVLIISALVTDVNKKNIDALGQIFCICYLI